MKNKGETLRKRLIRDKKYVSEIRIKRGSLGSWEYPIEGLRLEAYNIIYDKLEEFDRGYNFKDEEEVKDYFNNVYNDMENLREKSQYENRLNEKVKKKFKNVVKNSFITGTEPNRFQMYSTPRVIISESDIEGICDDKEEIIGHLLGKVKMEKIISPAFSATSGVLTALKRSFGLKYDLPTEKLGEVNRKWKKVEESLVKDWKVLNRLVGIEKNKTSPEVLTNINSDEIVRKKLSEL